MDIFVNLSTIRICNSYHLSVTNCNRANFRIIEDDAILGTRN
uniref:Uncharacterized protein n=1 Tax=Lepeophtheirus salmonis TaxID=72036 RepID=A0A0K2TFE2_LEPSM